MSYVLVLSDNAVQALRQLDVWLAEETLDELEGLADVPERLDNSASATSVYDFTRIRGDVIHYIFLVLRPEKTSETLQVQAIGHYSRSAGDSTVES